MPCASCGTTITAGGGDLCPYHVSAAGDSWHLTNRIICDLLHRGIEPRRLSEIERADEFWPAHEAMA